MWSSGLGTGYKNGAALYQCCEFKSHGGRTTICKLKYLILTLLA